MAHEDLIEKYARANGIDPAMLRSFVKIESGGRADAVTPSGTYRGLLQLSQPEFAKYGGGNIYDANDNLAAGAKKIRAEMDAYKAQYGRDPSATDLYLTHQQGAGGYAAHSANPDAPAWQNMASTGEGRQKGEGWARDAIWGNIPADQRDKFGSVDNVTSRDFMNLWQAKVEDFGGAPAVAHAPANAASGGLLDPVLSPPASEAMAPVAPGEGEGSGMLAGLFGAEGGKTMAPSAMAGFLPKLSFLNEDQSAEGETKKKDEDFAADASGAAQAEAMNKQMLAAVMKPQGNVDIRPILQMLQKRSALGV